MDAAGAEPLVVAATSLLVLVASAVFLHRQYRTFGWLGGWPGLVTVALLATGWLVVAAALWPLPTGQVCADGAAAPQLGMGATLSPLTLDAVLRWATLAAVFLPLGALAWYRYRCGAVATLAVGLVVAAGVQLVQFTAVFGAYPCAYRVATTDDVLAGGLGALLGWLVARPLTTRVLRRGWPAGIPDLLPPAGSRRLLALALDFAGWWLGSAVLTGVLVLTGAVQPLAVFVAHNLVLVGLALLLGGIVPLLSPLRQTLGRSAFALGLSEATGLAPAAHWRVLLRSGMLHAPVVILVVLGLGWWSVLVVLVHAVPAVVRRDQRGLADLLAGTRVVTRTLLRGGLPPGMIRYRDPDLPQMEERVP